MAPVQTVDPKDLPPEVQAAALAASTAAASGLPAPVAYPHGVMAAANAQGPVVPLVPSGPVAETPMTAGSAWLVDLDREARALLEHGQPEVWDHLTRQFEARLIQTALALTKGRRIEAAHKLGIGRNTITRKIQELRLEG
jgi:two-component system nitrogen regulation response regulator GlnG